MIKFHYHTITAAVDHLGLKVGDQACHVYSDQSLEELRRWCADNDVPVHWVREGHELPHVQLWGRRMELLCGYPTPGREVVEDMGTWRDRRYAEANARYA